MKLSELKILAKKGYVNKTELEILQELQKFSMEDINDMFYMEHQD